MKQITILGATGTIGVNTLDVIQRHTDRFSAFALTRKLPADTSFIIFAMGRLAGWIGHAFEQTFSGTLIRPRARYTGFD